MRGSAEAAARVPFVLLRFPGVFVAVFGAALVLGTTTAATSPFLSSAGNASLNLQLARTSAAFGGLSVSETSSLSPDRVAYRDRVLQDALRGTPGLGPEVFTAVVPSTSLHRVGSPVPAPPIIPVTRTGFLAHVEILAGSAGNPGWWIPDTVATELHLGPGDALILGVGTGERTVPVAGVYRDLHAGILERFWAPLSSQLCCSRMGDPFPPFILADQTTLMRVESPVAPETQMEWEFPLAGGTTLGGAKVIAPHLERAGSGFGNPRSPLGAGFLQGSTGLPSLLRDVQLTTAGLTGPVGTVGGAGTALALAVMAMAGVAGVRRRRTEFAILRARGASPLGVAARSSAEALLPAILGGAAGVVLAVAMVRALGPSSRIEPEAIRSAAAATAVAVLFGVAVLGLVCGVGPRGEEHKTAPDRGRLRARVARMPWESVVLALAAAALVEIETRGAGPVVTASTSAASAAGPAPAIDRMVLLFPVLFLAGLAGLAVRGLRRSLPRLPLGRSANPGPFLAVRRLAASPRSATALVGAAAAAFGMLIYGAILASSVQASTTDAARLAVGSDVAVAIPSGTPLPERLPNGTVVQRISLATLVPGVRDVDILAVDPRTFPAAVTWQGGFASMSLPDLLRNVGTAPASPGPVLHVVAVGTSLHPRSVISLSGVSIRVQEVASASAFPGMAQGRPLLVTSTAALTKALAGVGFAPSDVGADLQIWMRGDPSAAVAFLRRAKVSVDPFVANGDQIDPVTTAQGIERSPSFLAVSWSLGLLQVLGILAGVLALFGMLLYLQARQRAREVAFALAVRMGLTRRDHRRSVVAEIAGLLGAAFVLGSLLAVLAAYLVHTHIAQVPGPLGVRLAVPARPFLLSAVVLAIVSAVGAWLVQRSAEHANVAEAMRRVD